jgi:CheY-like chemotaxis protein
MRRRSGAPSRKTLQTFGYRVVTASGGPKGLSIYVHRQAEIAAVITDMMMPIMGGFAIIDASLRVNTQVKVIVVTGFVTDAQKQAAMLSASSDVDGGHSVMTAPG